MNAFISPPPAFAAAGRQPRWAAGQVRSGESGPGWHPGELASLLPGVRARRPDPERSAFTVIERTLAWGGRRELQWLFVVYGLERLADRGDILGAIVRTDTSAE